MKHTPLIGRKITVTKAIRSSAKACARVGSVGRRYMERQSSLQRKNRIQLPAAHDKAHRSGLVVSEWNRVVHTGDEALTDVEDATAVVIVSRPVKTRRLPVI